MSTVPYDHDARRRTAHAEHAHAAGFLRTYVFSPDHKIIGMQFLFSHAALVPGRRPAWPWASAGSSPGRGATMPIIGRMLFVRPKAARSRPSSTRCSFTMHATVMIFFVIIPILAGAFGNFLIPLMIGADDMAFPTLNMLSYWFMWPAFICIGASFFVGRTAPRRRAGPSIRRSRRCSRRRPAAASAQTLWLFGVTFVGVSSMMGSVNYMTTIIKMRAPGMTMFRLPMTIWAMFITAILQAFALPVLTAAGFMQLMRPHARHRLLPAGRR